MINGVNNMKRINCPSCGRFMRFVEIEEHPTANGEYYKRFECMCSGVEHEYIDAELVVIDESW